MLDRLFVYGSLMRAGRAHELLGELAASVPAQVTGRLYGLQDGYPMLVLDPDGDRIAGELVTLREPADAFSRLDPYEGPEYRRIVHPAQPTGGGPPEAAWIFVGRNDPPTELRLAADPHGIVRWDPRQSS